MKVSFYEDSFCRKPLENISGVKSVKISEHGRYDGTTNHHMKFTEEDGSVVYKDYEKGLSSVEMEKEDGSYYEILIGDHVVVIEG